MLSSDDYDGPGDGERRSIQDNVHGLIVLPPLAYRVINTSVFKRLKSLKQLGCCHEVYPSGNHTRFEHSLGVMHVAGKLIDALAESNQITEKDKLCVQIAGLCHDLGHGPYSHLWESFVMEANPDSKWTHEKSSLDMLDYLLKDYSIDLKEFGLDENDLLFIKELIYGPLDKSTSGSGYQYKGRGPEKFFLYEIISNKVTGVDVDKWDYFLRDDMNLKIGITFDYKRLLQNMKTVDWPTKDGSIRVKRIAIRDKEFDNCQEMFLDRARLHRKAYQHRVVKTYDRMLLDAWLASDPYMTVKGEGGKEYKLSEACEDVTAFVKLTDSLDQTIRNSDGDDMKEAREIMKRMDDRNLYRMVAQIENGTITGSEASYHESLTQFFNSPEADMTGPGMLRPEDIAIVKKRVNMGKGKTNPVLSMLFYNKHGEVEVKTEDDLKKIAPAQLAEENLFVLCRKNDKMTIEKARSYVEAWVKKFPDWQLKY